MATSSTSTAIMRLADFDEAADLIVAVFNTKEFPTAEDDDSFKNTDLRTLTAQSSLGGTFASKSCKWYRTSSHLLYKAPPANLSILDRQSFNLLSVMVVGMISGDAKVGPLGKTSYLGTPLGLRVATGIKGVMTLAAPPGANGEINYIYQDQARSIQAQYDRLLNFQASIGNNVTADGGFFLPGMTDASTAKFQVHVGPIYEKRAGKLSDTPTITSSPRKKRKRSDTSDDETTTQPSPTIPAPRGSVLDEMIRAREKEDPKPVAGLTTYEPALLPGFQSDMFESPADMVVRQLNILDVDGALVRPWDMQTVLVDGALVTANVTMVAWVIREKVMCHFVAESIQIFHRPNQSMCRILLTNETNRSEPGPSTVTTPAPASTPRASDTPTGNRHKAAKANDGSRISKAPKEKGKGKGKEKERDADADADADWEDVNP